MDILNLNIICGTMSVKITKDERKAVLTSNKNTSLYAMVLIKNIKSEWMKWR